MASAWLSIFHGTIAQAMPIPELSDKFVADLEGSKDVKLLGVGYI